MTLQNHKSEDAGWQVLFHLALKAIEVRNCYIYSRLQGKSGSEPTEKRELSFHDFLIATLSLSSLIHSKHLTCSLRCQDGFALIHPIITAVRTVMVDDGLAHMLGLWGE